jgi:hypothetical protein
MAGELYLFIQPSMPEVPQRMFSLRSTFVRQSRLASMPFFLQMFFYL